MKKLGLITLAMLFVAANAMALTVTYGWEDGGTVLGTYGTVLASNTNQLANTGSRSLKLVDNYSGSNTPQAYVAWIKNLQAGDIVTASFWVYDTTPGGSPSGRIWAHYNNSNSNVNQYDGSAGGNNTYSGSSPWSLLSFSWTMPVGKTGLIIEARTYSDGQDTIWVDDLTVTAPDHATIVTPAVPEPGSLLALASGIIGIAGIVIRRKN